MEKVPNEIKIFISNFISYRELLSSYKILCRNFNELNIRQPKVPHGPIINKTQDNNISVQLYLDGKFQWKYRMERINSECQYFVEDEQYEAFIWMQNMMIWRNAFIYDKVNKFYVKENNEYCKLMKVVVKRYSIANKLID